MSRKSRFGVAGIAAAALACSLAAAPAEAGNSTYTLSGDKGTVCTIDVAVNPTNGINGLQLPHVGFSGEPKCTYAGAGGGQTPAGTGTPASSVLGATKACKKVKKGKGKKAKRCKKRKKRGSARVATAAAAPRAANPAKLDKGVLRLILPLGLFYPGDDSLLYLITGGYACVLDQGADCSDNGNLTPAIPFIPVHTEFQGDFTPPAGESWIGVPPGCTGSGTVSCVLTTEPVVPTVL